MPRFPIEATSSRRSASREALLADNGEHWPAPRPAYLPGTADTARHRYGTATATLFTYPLVAGFARHTTLEITGHLKARLQMPSGFRCSIFFSFNIIPKYVDGSPAENKVK